MDYQKIYNQIIERAQNRNLEGYKEKHHILPRCMGGGDKKENLVELTAREHFICHKLLVKIYPKSKKLKWAFYNMCRFKKYSSNREYEIGRKELSKLQSKPILQYDLKGNFIKEWESGKEVSEKNGFNPINISSCLRKKGKSAHGFIWRFKENNVYLNIMPPKRKKHKERKPNKSGKYGIKKPIHQYDKDGKFIKEYEGIIDVKKDGFRPDAISACCRGVQKTSGGFIWRYKHNEDLTLPYPDLSQFKIYNQ